MFVGSSLVLSILALRGVLAALPEGWKGCKLSSPDYEECTKGEIANALSYLKNGSKKLGVQPVDPMRFSSVNLNQGTGPVSINMQLKDIDFKGLSESKILNVTNDAWKKMEIGFSIPHFELVGTYSIKGQVLVLPISGNGHCSFSMDDIVVKIDMTLEEAKKHGVTCYQVGKMAMDIAPKNALINFENLFNGNKALGDTMNRFLNENWNEIVNDVKPAISKTMGVGYMQYVNKILEKIPVEDINVK